MMHRRTTLSAAIFLPLLVPASASAQEAPATFGRIAVAVQQNGNPASGTFTVYRVDPSSGQAAEEAATGQTGNLVSVPVGTYDVVVRLDGAVDRPERWMRGVRVVTGQTVYVRRSFETAVLSVRVMARGRRAAGTVVLRRAGEETDLATVGSGVRALISAGNYDVLVRYRTQERWFRGVELGAGTARTLAADF